MFKLNIRQKYKDLIGFKGSICLYDTTRKKIVNMITSKNVYVNGIYIPAANEYEINNMSLSTESINFLKHT